MSAAIKNFWLKAVLFSAAGFAIGIAIYVSVGIIVAHGELQANAAFQQITITAAECECIVKFLPEQSLPGSGTVGDPYVTYNSRVPLLVGVTGTGIVTIEDQYGHVLYTYDKTSPEYAETIAQIDLPNGLGLYALTVKLNGVAAIDGPSVRVPMFIDYRALPLPPEPPNTGGLNYLYVGGYAVQTFGMIVAGILVAVVIFGIFMIVAMRRRRQQDAHSRNNAVVGKTVKKELSARSIDKSGVMGKRKVTRAKKKR